MPSKLVTWHFFYIKYIMPKSLTTEEFKERIKQISNGNIEIIGEYKGINSPISCKCNKCGHVWKNTPNHL